MKRISRNTQALITGGDRCDRWERRLLRYDEGTRRYGRTLGKYIFFCMWPEEW